MLAGAAIETAVQEPTVKDGPGSASAGMSPPGATSTQVGPALRSPSYVRTKLFVRTSVSLATEVGTSMTAVPVPGAGVPTGGSIEPVVPQFTVNGSIAPALYVP